MAWRAFGNPKYTKRMIQLAKKVLDVVDSQDARSAKEAFVCFAFMPDKQTGNHEFALDTGIAGEMLFKKMRTHCNAERGKKKQKKLTKGAWGTCQIKGKTLYVMPEQDVPSLRMLLKKRLLSEEFKEFKLNECRILKPGEKPPDDEDAKKKKKKKGDRDATLDPFQGKGKPKPRPGGKQGASPRSADPDATLEPSQGRGKPRPGGKRGAPSGPPADPDETINPFTGEPVKAAKGARAAKADPKRAAKDRKNLEKQRAALRKARQKWVQARDRADKDLELVKSAFQREYMDDPQIKVVNKKLRELDHELDKVGDDLRDVLDDYVAIPLDSTKALEKQAAKARRLIKQFSAYVDRSKLLAAVDDERGVGDAAKVKVKAPLGKALKELARAIG